LVVAFSYCLLLPRLRQRMRRSQQRVVELRRGDSDRGCGGERLRWPVPTGSEKTRLTQRVTPTPPVQSAPPREGTTASTWIHKRCQRSRQRLFCANRKPCAPGRRYGSVGRNRSPDSISKPAARTSHGLLAQLAGGINRGTLLGLGGSMALTAWRDAVEAQSPDLKIPSGPSRESWRKIAYLDFMRPDFDRLPAFPNLKAMFSRSAGVDYFVRHPKLPKVPLGKVERSIRRVARERS
jgi:hypothetical protein